MTKINRSYIALLFTGLFMAYTPITQADMQQGYDNQTGENRSYTQNANDPLRQPSYGDKIGKKALYAFANLTTGVLEIPKNIINTTNQSNFFYGLIGGGFKGFVHTAGRMGVGIAELLTFPIPTQPIAYPLFVWDDFDVDTTYGDVYRLDKTQKTVQPVTEAPAPVPTPPRAAVVDRSDQYNQETNRKLDRIFKKEMRK